jgi:hypothetical protein
MSSVTGDFRPHHRRTACSPFPEQGLGVPCIQLSTWTSESMRFSFGCDDPGLGVTVSQLTGAYLSLENILVRETCISQQAKGYMHCLAITPNINTAPGPHHWQLRGVPCQQSKLMRNMAMNWRDAHLEHGLQGPLSQNPLICPRL